MDFDALKKLCCNEQVLWSVSRLFLQFFLTTPLQVAKDWTEFLGAVKTEKNMSISKKVISSNII